MWSGKQLILCGVVVAFGAGTGCRPAEQTTQGSASVLGATASIAVPIQEDDTLVYAVQTVDNLNQRFTPLIDIYLPESEIARANQIAIRSRYPVSRDTQRIIEFGLRMSVELNGAFDITDATLRHMWERHFATEPDNLLSEPLVRASRIGVGHDRLIATANSVLYESPQMQLDLNDFVRPYIIDLAVVQLRRSGQAHLLVTLPDVGRTLGRATPVRGWNLPITHPVDEHPLGDLTFPDGAAFALVGWPRHFIQIGDQPVPRIINPLTGWPAAAEASVIVIGPVATEAYALSRALFNQPASERATLLARMPRYDAIFIERAAKPNVWITAALRNFVRMDESKVAAVHWIER